MSRSVVTVVVLLAGALAQSPSSAATLRADTVGSAQGGCTDSQMSTDATAGEVLESDCLNATAGRRAEARAVAQFGSIGIVAKATGTVSPGNQSVTANAEAQASVDDVLFMPIETGVIRFALDWLGSWQSVAEAAEASTLFANVTAEVLFSSNGVNFAPIDPLKFKEEYPVGSIGGTTFVDAPFSGGRTTYSLSGRTNAGCAVTASSGACYAEFAFGNSLRMTGLQLFDSEGNEILNPAVTSESGFDYVRGLEPHLPPIAPVPLPAGFPLMIGAIGSLVAMRRVRRG